MSQIWTSFAAVFATDSVPPQEPEETIERLVKAHMVQELTADGSANQVATLAAALRRYACPLSPAASACFA